MKEIPNEVLEFFKYDIETYRGHVRLLGKYNGKDAYTYEYDEEVIIGYPSVCLYKKDSPLEIAVQQEALRVLREVKKRKI
jgi:hypothetical protein